MFEHQDNELDRGVEFDEDSNLTEREKRLIDIAVRKAVRIAGRRSARHLAKALNPEAALGGEEIAPGTFYSQPVV